ncbi:lytic transglycosylase domain-containing protein [Lysinibacillus sp. FSL M8-0216]|uniref:Soluble lytic murein transglycosylase n=1 Tax=Lysinibacillus fusiformis TaxID=28031 RepID=A0A1H9M794_9BACI|nr:MULTISPECIES: lytic transglycosylase domain-containing protein [Lysinibacillus]MED4078783.1 lytic transglycosylase domain-containing protein [Lysinibacillus fusiformis]MED4668341.1 lytic transglycosylase domain-containing protein [Lysinibacillus fusiformis]SCX67282.1 Soluble lytic murein transglycosylase [Lysinibacillus fusiformis]SCY59273.1 Soluble lytic murein transglycosylase [Lysinibacillus fusiformis]SDB53511.1 Soluble lytic murein transglycosylase [Lysinibacillus fusiformis]
MDIQSLRSLMEIQALQTLGSTDGSSTNALTDNQSIFSDMMNELLGDASTASNAKLSSLLGLGTANADIFNQLANTSEGTLESLLYKGSNAVYIPESVKQALTSSYEHTKLDSYVSDNVIGSTAYANSLAGADQYAAIIEKASATYGVPEKLIAAVIKQESNFNPSVVSHAGAQGLMQLMPQTAQYLGVTNAFDPEQNIMAGAKYLRQMLDKFNNDPTLALAAYNAGASRVTKYGGIPPFKETQNYVKKVMNYFTV